MNILFIGAFTTDSYLNKVGNKFESLYSVSQYIIKGFRKFSDINLSVINSPDIASYPAGPLYIKAYYDIKENVQYVSSFNIPFLNQLWTIFTMVYHSYLIIRKNSEITFIIIPYMVFRHVMTSRILKLIFHNKVKICMIVPDIFFPSRKQRSLYCTKYVTERIAGKSDCFVLFTGTMIDYLRIHTKPFIIMEGVIDKEYYKTIQRTEKPDRPVILYTGALNNDHGVLRLFDMIRFLENQDVDLWITGFGYLEDEIRRIADGDSRITFWGKLPKQEVIEMQKKATLLINPRMHSDGNDTTRYLFPSKILEYLLSGNPTVICRLPGIPDDYYQYVIVSEDGNPESLAMSVKKILQMTEEERNQFGKKAQQFIIKEKNYEIQTERILNLMRKQTI
jgi:glycosyltransferase involved in cell wall biosynthesis